jgi:membrane-associated phospholipid phosphatase
VQGNWALWGVACATTGAGRVLADAHWFTDTLAASCLGGCVVSLLALVVRKVVHGNALKFFRISDFANGNGKKKQ